MARARARARSGKELPVWGGDEGKQRRDSTEASTLQSWPPGLGLHSRLRREPDPRTYKYFQKCQARPAVGPSNALSPSTLESEAGGSL